MKRFEEALTGWQDICLSQSEAVRSRMTGAVGRAAGDE